MTSVINASFNFHLGKDIMRSSVLANLVAGGLLACVCTAASAQVTVPNTFTAGTPARAADVNANFQALATAINGLSSRVAKLEGQITAADLVGNYRFNVFQTELEGGTTSHVSVYTQDGTATLSANGTATFAGAAVEEGHQLSWLAGSVSARSTIFRTGGLPTSTWSHFGSTVRMFDRNFSVVAGGRLLILTTTNPADGTNAVIFLTRTN